MTVEIVCDDSRTGFILSHGTHLRLKFAVPETLLPDVDLHARLISDRTANRNRLAYLANATSPSEAIFVLLTFLSDREHPETTSQPPLAQSMARLTSQPTNVLLFVSSPFHHEDAIAIMEAAEATTNPVGALRDLVAFNAFDYADA